MSAATSASTGDDLFTIACEAIGVDVKAESERLGAVWLAVEALESIADELDALTTGEEPGVLDRGLRVIAVRARAASRLALLTHRKTEVQS